MRHRPPDLSDDEVRTAIAGHWSFADASDAELVYMPIGAGSHHWRAARFFVTVDDLRDKPFLGRDPETVYARLRDALEGAFALRENGLEFVIAPLAGHNGNVVCRLGKRYAIALYPYLGEPQPIPRTLTPEQHSAVAKMLPRLHAMPPSIGRRASRVRRSSCRTRASRRSRAPAISTCRCARGETRRCSPAF